MKTIHRVAVVQLLLVAILASVPVFAQERDLSGDWAPIQQEDNFEGHPFKGEYIGLPINDAARMRADSWSPSWLTLLEWQCRPHGAAYLTRDPSRLRIDKEADPITRETTAFVINMFRGSETRIYMDGRPHPSQYHPHTWNGFSTGKWVGDTLKVRTTHLKENIIRRNGLPVSDRAEVIRYFARRGDVLSVTVITYDPAYLTEPLIQTTEYRRTPDQQMPPYPCNPAVEIVRKKGEVPHYLPGKNPDLYDYSFRFKVPLEGAKGGAETMYPEFEDKARNGKAAESQSSASAE